MAADAIVSGDLRTLKQLLRDDPELVRARSTRAHHAPLIHYVAANGVENFRQKTPRNIVEITKVLLKAGADVDATSDEYGGASTALGLAATSYHPAKAGVQMKLLDTLLKAGASIEGAPGGWNPLVAALHNGRGKAAAYLAERGARLDLEGAIGTGHLEVMAQYFSDNGKLTGGATRKQLNYGFIWACEFGQTDAVRFLLDRGFKPQDDFMNGETGLHWAAFGGHADIVKLLLESNVPVNAKEESYGGTPLGWAVYGWNDPAPEFRRSKYYEVVKLLVCAGGMVDWKWIESPNRVSTLAANIRSDKRMMSALMNRSSASIKVKKRRGMKA
jgi:ankyrin repeat protein